MSAIPMQVLESYSLGDHPRYLERPAVRGQLALVRSLIDEIERLGPLASEYAEAVHDQLRDELARLMRLMRAESSAA
jgi:hypothetical protein